MTEYDINYACADIERYIANNDIFIEEIRMKVFTVIAAAHKYAKIKEALV